MKKLFIFLALWTLTLCPVAAHASGITYNFELGRLLDAEDYNDPSTFYLALAHFSLQEGTHPDSVGFDPPFGVYAMQFLNVPYSIELVAKNVVVKEISGIGRVTFYRDGIQLLPDEFDVYDVAPPVDWTDPNHPVFKTGYVYNGNFAWYNVTAQTPEPSSLILLGSGVLGIVGVFRRRLANV